jgi:hypothetical protein
MSNKNERGISKAEMDKILSKTEVRQKIMNSFNAYLKFEDDCVNAGLKFKKQMTKFSKSSAAMYFPKRLVGRKFTVYLVPIDDGYEVSEPGMAPPKRTPIEKEKVKETEKVKKIQAPEKEPERKNLLNIFPKKETPTDGNTGSTPV